MEGPPGSPCSIPPPPHPHHSLVCSALPMAAVPPYWCGFLLNVCIPLTLGAVGGWRLCLVLLHFVAPSPTRCLAGNMPRPSCLLEVSLITAATTTRREEGNSGCFLRGTVGNLVGPSHPAPSRQSPVCVPRPHTPLPQLKCWLLGHPLSITCHQKHNR